MNELPHAYSIRDSLLRYGIFEGNQKISEIIHNIELLVIHRY